MCTCVEGIWGFWVCACVKCLGIVGVYMCEVSRDCGCVHVWSALGMWVCTCVECIGIVGV